MKAWKLSLLAAATMSASAAYAVEPQGIELGSGVTLLPSVGLKITDNDNIYLQDSDNEVSSTITRLTPAVGVNVDMGATVIDALVKGEIGQYTKDDNDDYTDANYAVGVASQLTDRNAIRGSVTLNQGHDARGSGTLEGTDALNTDKPDQYDETTVFLNYVYGAESSMLNASVGVEQYSKDYKNNKDVTSDREHDKTKLTARLDINVSSATKAIVELRNTDISYDNDSAIAGDGSVLTGLVGASWDITGKTTGEVKLGMIDRDFDDSAKDADSRFTWEASVTYSPLSYSVITLTTAQAANETTSAGLGSYIASDFTALNWKHEFSPFVALSVDASLNNSEYVDAANDREDEVVAYGISGVFSPSKNVDVVVGYKASERSSNVDGLDYDQKVIDLTMSVAI